MITVEPIVDPWELDGDKILVSQRWLRYFNEVTNILAAPNRDAGPFTPVFSGLTESDSTKITKTGSFVRQGKLLYFEASIITASGATTSSTLGTTFFALPSLLQARGGNEDIVAAGHGSLNAFNVDTPFDFGGGYVNFNTLNAFTPSWSGISDTISITGLVRIQGL